MSAIECHRLGIAMVYHNLTMNRQVSAVQIKKIIIFFLVYKVIFAEKRLKNH